MHNEYICDEYVPTFSTGSVSTLDTTVKSRKKKHPLGFSSQPQKSKRKVKPRASRRS